MKTCGAIKYDDSECENTKSTYQIFLKCLHFVLSQVCQLCNENELALLEAISALYQLKVAQNAKKSFKTKCTKNKAKYQRDAFLFGKVKRKYLH